MPPPLRASQPHHAGLGVSVLLPAHRPLGDAERSRHHHLLRETGVNQHHHRVRLGQRIGCAVMMHREPRYEDHPLIRLGA